MVSWPPIIAPRREGRSPGDRFRSRLRGDGIKDGVTSYDEVSCSRGALGRIRGVDLMPFLIDKADRSEKFGA